MSFILCLVECATPNLKGNLVAKEKYSKTIQNKRTGLMTAVMQNVQIFTIF